jgi:hypothetical protein
MYNKRTWLNKDESHGTSSIVCFHGDVLYGKEILDTAFIEITDCYHKVRLHVGDEYNYKEYVNKIDRLIDELSAYRNYLVVVKNLKVE